MPLIVARPIHSLVPKANTDPTSEPHISPPAVHTLYINDLKPKEVNYTQCLTTDRPIAEQHPPMHLCRYTQQAVLILNYNLKETLGNTVWPGLPTKLPAIKHTISEIQMVTHTRSSRIDWFLFLACSYIWFEQANTHADFQIS